MDGVGLDDGIYNVIAQQSHAFAQIFCRNASLVSYLNQYQRGEIAVEELVEKAMRDITNTVESGNGPSPPFVTEDQDEGQAHLLQYLEGAFGDALTAARISGLKSQSTTPTVAGPGPARKSEPQSQPITTRDSAKKQMDLLYLNKDIRNSLLRTWNLRNGIENSHSKLRNLTKEIESTLSIARRELKNAGKLEKAWRKKADQYRNNLDMQKEAEIRKESDELEERVKQLTKSGRGEFKPPARHAEFGP